MATGKITDQERTTTYYFYSFTQQKEAGQLLPITSDGIAIEIEIALRAPFTMDVDHRGFDAAAIVVRVNDLQFISSQFFLLCSRKTCAANLSAEIDDTVYD